jgi:hypothetical protein
MLRQTRNALIYSDLALFVLDAREGLTYNDVALYKWLHYHKMRLPSELRRVTSNTVDLMTEEERYALILKEEEKYNKEVKRDLQLGHVQLPGEDRPQTEFDKRAFLNDKRAEEFRGQFRSTDDIFLSETIKIPEIIYLANKSEDGF